MTPNRVSEGDGEATVTVTAALDAGARAVATPVTVSVRGSGDADAVDFEDVVSFEIVIPAGDHAAEGTFTLVPEDDRVHETDETLAVAGTSDLPVTGTSVVLADDDETSQRIALNVVPVQVSEGDGATPITVTAALEGVARTTDTAVTVSVVRSGNAGVVDFADVASFEIVIPTGGQSAEGTFTLVPEDDRVDEADETVEITGTSDLPVTSASVIITDNDATAGLINLAVAPARVSEHDGSTRVTVTAALDGGARTVATPVTVSVTGSGNPDAVDFAPVSDFRIAIGGGGATRGSGTFVLVPEDDDDDEVDETLVVRGVADLRVVSTTVVLADDDKTSTRIILSLSARPATISEGDGPTMVTVTGSLDGAPRDMDTVVAVSVSGGGEDAAVDFTPVGDFEVRIRAGALSGESAFVLVPEDDRLDEMDETVTVSGIAELAVVPALLTLVDNDRTPMISVNDATVIESADEVAFTVSLDPATDARVTVEYATADTAGQPDAATAGEDYGHTSGRLEFAPGELEKTVRVPILDDALEEPDETFALRLSNPSGAALEVGTATGTIVDNDAPLQVFRVLLFESAAHPSRQGFLRVINHSARGGEVEIEAVDDGGMRRDPIRLSIDAAEAAHFNSNDLEDGNPEQGLSGGVGPPSQGDWHLTLTSGLDIEVLTFARTKRDGFVTTLHDSVPVASGVHRVSFFNPGRNTNQQSLLRLVNTGDGDVEATVSGVDDEGVESGEVQIEIPARRALTLSAAELESGVAGGIAAGALGTGTGKWRLTVSSPLPLAVKSLLTSPPGYLANLSTSPRTPGSDENTHGVPWFPSLSDADHSGVVRVINHSARAGEVRIVARDDSGREYGPVTLAVDAAKAVHFNSADLELGNPARGLTGSTGAGTGSWRLDLSSARDIEVLSYVRSHDQFLTPMHDLAPLVDGAHRVAFFNPASNERQVSRLRLINGGAPDATVRLTGVDDAGRTPGTPVRLRVMGGRALEVTAAELESGTGPGIEAGALGDGEGKWRLRLESDRPIRVMSLLDSPSGHVTNLSTTL